MFGLLGSVIFGIVYGTAWSKDENQEQNMRKYAKEKNLPYYIDKKGRQRWTTTGKKRTPQEILQEKKEQTLISKQICRNYVVEELLNSFKIDYERFIIHKDRLSFEEYVVMYAPKYFFDKYDEFAEMNKNVSLERKMEILNNRVYYS